MSGQAQHNRLSALGAMPSSVTAVFSLDTVSVGIAGTVSFGIAGTVSFGIAGTVSFGIAVDVERKG